MLAGTRSGPSVGIVALTKSDISYASIPQTTCIFPGSAAFFEDMEFTVSLR